MKSPARKTFRSMLDEDGPSAVGYALMLSLLLLAALTAITIFGHATATCGEYPRTEITNPIGP